MSFIHQYDFYAYRVTLCLPTHYLDMTLLTRGTFCLLHKQLEMACMNMG